MNYSGAQIIVKLLERQGIETIFGIPGGTNLPIYDALYDSRIRHILARHEQGGGFMAQGMARSTGRPAVCMATSGPGATNLITAIADAKLDSIPIIAITGQVSTSLIGTDAFQEVDTYGLTLPITKHNFLVQNTADLLEVIPEAFRIAQSGRPGPVAIDIPKDIQTQTISVCKWPEPGKAASLPECDSGAIDQMAESIRQAERPVCYIGGGVIAADASAALLKLVRKNRLPVVSTLMGLGCIPHDDPLFLGMLGMHGSRSANLIMEEADLIVALGIRFDDRATGKIETFCERASVIHVDIDHSEIDKLKNAGLGICGDVRHILDRLLPMIAADERLNWHERIRRIKMENPSGPQPFGDLRHPAEIIRQIGRILPADAIITTDVGQHQMWTAQTFPFQRPRSFLTSGGLGTMGFGLPAAIGAALANPAKKVVCISGDGSFLMNIQELATLSEHDLNITVIVMNNGHLGLVRQQQELFYCGRYCASKFRQSPDFAAVAEGFGITGMDLQKTGNPEQSLETALRKTGPCVVNAPIDHRINVYPMVPPGASNLEMIEGGN